MVLVLVQLVDMVLPVVVVEQVVQHLQQEEHQLPLDVNLKKVLGNQDRQVILTNTGVDSGKTDNYNN